jgi:hypothetical protein
MTGVKANSVSALASAIIVTFCGIRDHFFKNSSSSGAVQELSPIFGDGLIGQAAAVAD